MLMCIKKGYSNVNLHFKFIKNSNFGRVKPKFKHGFPSKQRGGGCGGSA